MNLVLLHGLPLDSGMWSGQIDIHPGSTIAPTLYRLGNSIEEWAGNVLNLAGDGPLVVVGCSMGGSCALEMVRQSGDRIAAMVLVGTKAGHRPEPEMRDGYVAALRERGIAGVWPNLVNRVFGDATSSAAKAAEQIAMQQSTADLVRATEVFHNRPDATEVVLNWRKPLVVITGDQDGIVSVARSAEMAKQAPFGQLHIMQGCGHFPNLERPEEFNRIVGNVLHSASK